MVNHKPLKEIGIDRESGTEITFQPSKKTFSLTEFNFKKLESRLRELAYLNSGVNIKLVDLRNEKETISELSSRGGLKGYVKFLDKSREAIVDNVIFFKGSNDDISVECAFNGIKVIMKIS